ncbi:hypothetical protein [Nonomuraea jabiensis]
MRLGTRLAGDKPFSAVAEPSRPATARPANREPRPRSAERAGPGEG